MRIGAIDIGTNSVRLLIGEKDKEGLDRVVEKLEVPRLGEDLNQLGYLKEEAIERTIKVLEGYKSLIDKWNAVPQIVGTSAAREAENSSEFVNRVKEEVGFKVNLISGEREAYLSYRGAVSDLSSVSGKVQLVDIGGGSTELVYGKEKKLLSYKSIQLGAVRLKEKWGMDTLQTRKEVKNKFDFLEQDFKHLVGVGGTITTLAAIKQQLSSYDRDKIHGFILGDSELEGLLEQLEEMPLEEREKMPGLSPDRADIIIPGLIILLGLLEQVGVSKITVSGSGILEGIIYEEG